jgi:hypothetical protein
VFIEERRESYAFHLESIGEFLCIVIYNQMSPGHGFTIRNASGWRTIHFSWTRLLSLSLSRKKNDRISPVPCPGLGLLSLQYTHTRPIYSLAFIHSFIHPSRKNKKKSHMAPCTLYLILFSSVMYFILHTFTYNGTSIHLTSLQHGTKLHPTH